MDKKTYAREKKKTINYIDLHETAHQQHINVE